MDMEQLKQHALKYSKTFKKDGTGLWKTDFDAMACKTVIKLNLSKYAPLSIEMQKAVLFDQARINNIDTEDVTYIDGVQDTNPEINREAERVQMLIEEATEPEHLSTKLWEEAHTHGLLPLFDKKKEELTKAGGN